jgi:hypothetical protein
MALLFSNGSFQELINKYFYINSNQNNNKKEFKYELFEILLEDELSQQIILTLVLFCLLKIKEEPKEIQTLLEKYNYPIDDMIFPLNFLKIKFYLKSNNIQQAIDNINKLITKYEEYNINIAEKKLDTKNILTIETFQQKFIYFDNLFNYLFNMNNLEAKIKKLYFELKSCFYQINCFSQGFYTILNLYQKFPDDILIQFELAKDSVINSKPDVFNNILEKMKKNKEEEKDDYIKGIYTNYILYSEALNEIAYNKYAEAKNKFEEILELRKNEKDNNIILKNNIALMDIYKTNLEEGYNELNNIYQDKTNENKNEYIKDTINNIRDKFNIK